MKQGKKYRHNEWRIAHEGMRGARSKMTDKELADAERLGAFGGNKPYPLPPSSRTRYARTSTRTHTHSHLRAFTPGNPFRAAAAEL